ncbi:PspC domain-containing protein [Sphingomonas sp. IC-11]|uniref:PspC domain-containing protein n=1 Tax=Sphingomonas sp. IC-11 TaxID=2898528 RepID=UPI001E305F36|nr:PspC domain-containing protein [Sphingomonas sp. IC-11]MCD2314599.1 PspC domain-containing protein [Sphingomonas sp. IC-11]
MNGKAVTDRSNLMTTEAKKLTNPKDNLLGICNALGEDFGFNPLWLRLALGAAFVIQPVGVVVTYLALGLVVLVSRIAFPNARAKHDLQNVSASAEPTVTPANEPEGPAFAQAA